MAQALLNNLNTTVDLQQQSASPKDFASTDFQKLLDKKTNAETNDTTVSGTLGAMKNSLENVFNEFNDILSKVTQEVAEESALDLTLEKDIQEIESALPTEEQETPTTENIVDTQNILQVILPKQEENVENIQLQTSESEELNVTLNGMALEDALEGFNTQKTEEMPVVNISKSEAETDIEGKTLEDLVDEDVLKELNIESLEAETPDSGEGSDLMQNQTAQEQGIKAALNLDQTSYQEIKPAEVTATKQTTPATDSSKLLEQVSKQMDKLFNGSKLEIVMNPESLGKVAIQLINTKEGLTAQFTAATVEARNLLMKGLDGLKESLVSQGVNVDNVSVKLSETQEGEYNSDWTEQEGSRGGNKEQGQRRGHKEEKQFENLMSKEEEK